MGYELVELGDVIANIATGPFGSNLKVSCFVPKGFPVVDGANLRGYKLTDNITKFVTDEKARSLSRSIAHRGDVVATISGNVGQVAYIPDDSAYAGYLCSQRQFKMSFDTNRVYVPYLVYYLHTREGQHQILSFVNQTGVPALAQPTKNFKRIVVPLPSLKQQMAITRIPELLDDAIELNSRTNGYLEELIDSKFSEDFGNGCPLVKLGEVLRISTESVNPRQHAEEMWEHYSIPAFDNSHQPTFELASNIKSNKYVVSRNSILISKLNPSIKRFWLPACSTQHAVCSTEFIVYETKNPAHKSFYAAALSSDAFQKYLLAHVTGSTGSRQRTQPKSTLEYPMPHPSEADIDEFCAFADPIYTRIECNERESAGLSQLRNALLPKLMSGEIDVSKVEVPTQPNSHLYEN